MWKIVFFSYTKINWPFPDVICASDQAINCQNSEAWKNSFHQEDRVKEHNKFCKIWSIKNIHKSTFTVCFLEAETITQAVVAHLSEELGKT